MGGSDGKKLFVFLSAKCRPVIEGLSLSPHVAAHQGPARCDYPICVGPERHNAARPQLAAAPTGANERADRHDSRSLHFLPLFTLSAPHRRPLVGFDALGGCLSPLFPSSLWRPRLVRGVFNCDLFGRFFQFFSQAGREGRFIASVKPFKRD